MGLPHQIFNLVPFVYNLRSFNYWKRKKILCEKYSKLFLIFFYNIYIFLKFLFHYEFFRRLLSNICRCNFLFHYMTCRGVILSLLFLLQLISSTVPQELRELCFQITNKRPFSTNISHTLIKHLLTV